MKKCKICAIPCEEEYCIRHENPLCFICKEKSVKICLNGIGACEKHKNNFSILIPLRYKK